MIIDLSAKNNPNYPDLLIPGRNVKRTRFVADAFLHRYPIVYISANTLCYQPAALNKGSVVNKS